MPTPVELHDIAVRALDTLSHDPVGQLRAMGIKGDYSAASCPVQQYLTRLVPTGDEYKWYVTTRVATAIRPQAEGDILHQDRVYLYVDLPSEVKAFISAFDDGLLPDLWDDEKGQYV